LPFTTGSDSASTFSATDWSIADGYNAMPVNGGISLQFNAPLNIVSCPVSDHVSISDGVNNIAYDWEVSDDRNRRHLTLTPTAALSANTTYTVTIDGLCDSVGNALPAISQNFTTTAVTDNTGPTLVSVSPADNATGVGLTTPVVWTFSEPVWFDLSPIENYVYLYVGSGSNKLSGELDWNADRTTVTFTPSVAYPANTVIDKRLSYHYLRDMAGNAAAYNGNFYGEFTTE
ncbi:MAG: Ig-like domain-containing protein, partial [Gammaproteobacteria bacterium]|nr:Ig-like domain-containing protein [Gammaproteobacteria bacterium]